MFLSTVAFLPLFLLPHSQTTAITSCVSRQVTFFKNSVTSSWMIARHQLARRGSLRGCSALCLQEPVCMTFLYNDVTKDCRLFEMLHIEEELSFGSSGYRYYRNCRATAGYYGDPCWKTSHCRLNNSTCLNFTCRCEAGFSFHPTNGNCTLKCVRYGTEFERYPQSCIWVHDLQVFVINATACMERCIQATAYTCRTFDMTADGTICYLQDVTKLDVPADWRESFPYDHYQRHCAP